MEENAEEVLQKAKPYISTQFLAAAVKRGMGTAVSEFLNKEVTIRYNDFAGNISPIF